MDEEIVYDGGTVEGICPETGNPYTMKAGDDYVTPGGTVISSAGFAHGVEDVDETASTGRKKAK